MKKLNLLIIIIICVVVNSSSIYSITIKNKFKNKRVLNLIGINYKSNNEAGEENQMWYPVVFEESGEKSIDSKIVNEYLKNNMNETASMTQGPIKFYIKDSTESIQLDKKMTLDEFNNHKNIVTIDENGGLSINF